MLTAATILKIIELSLAIILEVIQDLTPEQKAAAWERHEKRMEFYHSLLDKVKD